MTTPPHVLAAVRSIPHPLIPHPRQETAMPAPEPTADVRELLDQLDQAHAAGRPGPWAVDLSGGSITAGDVYAVDSSYAVAVADPADAALIVAAVNALPELIAKAREMDARIRAGLALADALTSMAKSTRTSSLPHTRPGATERARLYDDLAAQLRAALAAPLAGQHTTEDTREKD